MEQKISIWPILFYLSMAVLTLWLILKVTGVINTPLWLELGIPMASLILGIFAFCHNIMKNIGNLAIGLATLTTKVGYIGRDVSSLIVSGFNSPQLAVNHKPYMFFSIP